MEDLMHGLKSIANEHRIIERTWENFWYAYNSYITEDREEAEEYGMTDKDSVIPEFYSLAYKIFHDDSEIIEATIRMYDKEHHYLGYYDDLFDMNGEGVDDFFVIE